MENRRNSIIKIDQGQSMLFDINLKLIKRFKH